MARAKDKRAERLAEETQRLLDESRKDLRRLDIPENEARANIRSFLEHLEHFDDINVSPDPNDPDNEPPESARG